MKTCVCVCVLNHYRLLCAHLSRTNPVRMSPYGLYGLEAINVDFYDRF